MEGESSKTYFFGNGDNSVPAWMAMNNGGLFGGNGGWGGGILGFLLGLFFGNGWGGFGGFGNGFGGNSGAGFLSNQIDNNAGRELLMNAINSNGEASRSAIQNLATMLGQDYNQVSTAVAAIQSGLSNLALQQAVSVPQIINSVQSGNCALQSQLAQCCCENRLLTTQQGYEAQIRTLEQTNQLGSQADRNTRTLADQIAAQTVAMNDGFCQIKERELQGKIDSLLAENTSLKTALSEGRQTQQFTAAFNILDNKITELAAKQPNTLPVQWPNVQAVNTTPYMGGYNGFYGNGFGGNVIF
jgi:hypothetical protein